eukprot:3047206-Prymnesium_polylepis.1
MHTRASSFHQFPYAQPSILVPSVLPSSFRHHCSRPSARPSTRPSLASRWSTQSDIPSHSP